MQEQKDLIKHAKIQHKWHLLICVCVLLVVFGLAVQRTDLYSPTTAEFLSYNHVGVFLDEARSPVSIIDSVIRNSKQHTPGYFILLSAWGNLISWEIPVTRYLGIVLGLLSIAIMYRLASDFVAPIGGIFVVVILSSTAFFHFYFAHVRMYSMLMFVGVVTLWLYLRIMYQLAQPKIRDYGALGISAFVLLYTHIFSFTFLLALGVYHVFFVSKNRQWLWVSLVVSGAVLIFSPYSLVILDGLSRVVERRFDKDLNFITFVETFIRLFFNGQISLAVVPIVGLIVAGIKKSSLLQPYMILGVIHILVIGVVAEFTETITDGGMRYFFGGWGTLLLIVITGLVVLYRINRLTLLVLPVWIVAGIHFGAQTSWFPYIEEQVFTLGRSPVQQISRLAKQEDRIPFVIGYNEPESFLNTESSIGISQREYYFDRHDIQSDVTDDIDRFSEIVNFQTLTTPMIWVYTKQSRTSSEQLQQLHDIMQEAYQLCETANFGVDTLMYQYYWHTLQTCELPSAEMTAFSSDIVYEVAQVTLDTEGDIWIVDRWHTDNPSRYDGWNFSYQLLTDDWEKVGQLDLPLVNEGIYRQFKLDLADVPSDNYRLVGVLYNADTGERLAWSIDEQSIGDLLTLSEIFVP